MSVYLNTMGKSSLAIAICDRCKLKFSITELMSDPNSPGLRVCRKDVDDLDPYRLPQRQPDQITLAFVRPDAPLGTDPAGLVTENDNGFIIGTNEEYLVP